MVRIFSEKALKSGTCLSPACPWAWAALGRRAERGPGSRFGKKKCPKRQAPGLAGAPGQQSFFNFGD